MSSHLWAGRTLTNAAKEHVLFEDDQAHELYVSDNTVELDGKVRLRKDGNQDSISWVWPDTEGGEYDEGLLREYVVNIKEMYHCHGACFWMWVGNFVGTVRPDGPNICKCYEHWK